ncbi:MAG TPA: ABC transporter ATP-binding protein [Clostridiales bacterium]|nr:ABC transporter ATP-binding protein [Clostridiales bacterium]
MILSVDGLSFAYPSHPVLHDVSFTIGQSDCVAVLGTNGTGKSTLLKCINRILKPKAGAVLINGKGSNTLSRLDIAKNIGYVSQYQSLPKITVFDSVLLGRKPYIKWDAGEKDLEIVNNALKELDLLDYAMRYTDELSGGELQKVVIARALAQEPKLFLLDEPTSSLDIKNQLDTISVIKKVAEKQNIAVIVTMHDINLALRFANRFILMKNGRIFGVGGKEIITAESIEEVYGVKAAVYEIDGFMIMIPENHATEFSARKEV